MIVHRLLAWSIGALLAFPPMTVRAAQTAAEPQQRAVEAPTAVQWPEQGEASSPPAERSAAKPAHTSDDKKSAQPPPPRPTTVRDSIDVGIGLSPDAVGSKPEKALLDRLEASAKASVDPTTRVRRLRPGTGTGREICRQRRDDLVVLIGYVPEREEPVVLAYDCRLDRALDLRAVTSVDQPALIRVLWDEHDELIRQGVRERRQRRPLGTKARVILAAGVALVVVGVAVGVLVASALREEKVVLKVGP